MTGRSLEIRNQTRENDNLQGIIIQACKPGGQVTCVHLSCEFLLEQMLQRLVKCGAQMREHVCNVGTQSNYVEHSYIERENAQREMIKDERTANAVFRRIRLSVSHSAVERIYFKFTIRKLHV